MEDTNSLNFGECSYTDTSKHTTQDTEFGVSLEVYLAAPSLEAKYCLAKEQIAKRVADGLVDKRRRGQEPANRLFRGLVARAVLMSGLRRARDIRVRKERD